MTLLDHARAMRRDPTEAEKRLWRALRTKQLHHLKFRRQQPIGRFIVDFDCAAAKLVVEVDGGAHAESEADVIRDRWLETQNIQVLRIWKNDVIQNIEGVLEYIQQFAGGIPPPAHSHKGRGK